MSEEQEEGPGARAQPRRGQLEREVGQARTRGASEAKVKVWLLLSESGSTGVMSSDCNHGVTTEDFWC